MSCGLPSCRFCPWARATSAPDASPVSGSVVVLTGTTCLWEMGLHVPKTPSDGQDKYWVPSSLSLSLSLSLSHARARACACTHARTPARTHTHGTTHMHHIHIYMYASYIPHVRLKTTGSKRLQDTLLQRKGKGEEHRPDEVGNKRQRAAAAEGSKPTRESRSKAGKDAAHAAATAAAKANSKKDSKKGNKGGEPAAAEMQQEQCDAAPATARVADEVDSASSTGHTSTARASDGTPAVEILGARRTVPLSAVPSSADSAEACFGRGPPSLSPLYDAGLRSERTTAAVVQELKSELAGKDATLAEQKDRIAELSSACAALQEQLREKDMRIITLEREQSALVLASLRTPRTRHHAPPPH